MLKKLDLEQQAKSVNVTKIMEAPKKQEKDDLQPELVCNVAGLSLENTSENVSARPSTKQNPKVTAVPNPKSKLKVTNLRLQTFYGFAKNFFVVKCGG